MQQFYKTHTKAVIPSSFPDSTTEDNDETEEDATSPRTRSMDVQVPGPSHQPADGTSEEPEEQQRTTPKTPRKQKKPTKSPLKGTHASPMTLQQKTFEIVKWIKATEGDFIHSNISAAAIGKQFQFHDGDHKRKVCRVVNNMQDLEREQHLAQKFVHKLARRKKIKVHQLAQETIEPIMREDVNAYVDTLPNPGRAWGNTRTSAIYNNMIAIVNSEKYEYNSITDDDLRDATKNQEWPNVFIKDTGTGRGKGVYTGLYGIKKGSVVCDYHGINIKKIRREKRLKNYPSLQCNYMYFIRQWVEKDALMLVYLASVTRRKNLRI